MKIISGALAGSAAVLIGSLLAASPASAGLVINPVFASTYTCPAAVCGGIDPSTVESLAGNPDAEAAITAAANQIASRFGNNVTTNILFYGVHYGPNSFLGASLSSTTVYSYSQYTAALAADAAAHPKNTTLNSAVANLGSGNGAGDPNALIAVNVPDARALGLNDGVLTTSGVVDSTPQFDATGNYVGTGGFADGVVLLNLDQPLAFTRPVPPISSGVFYDARSTMQHEIDEIIGAGGGGSQLNDFNFDPNYAMDFFGVRGSLYGPLDLFRYAAPGTPSFDPTTISVTGCGPPTCSGAPSPYFSVDGGVTAIDTFNQAFPLIGGDAGDWGLNLFKLCAGGGGIGGTGDLQDAFSCNNHSSDVWPSRPSGQALQAIGYNAVPEPAGWVVMLIGVAGLGLAARTRRRALVTA